MERPGLERHVLRVFSESGGWGLKTESLLRLLPYRYRNAERVKTAMRALKKNGKITFKVEHQRWYLCPSKDRAKTPTLCVDDVNERCEKLGLKQDAILYILGYSSHLPRVTPV
jgi:hypothetical protein